MDTTEAQAAATSVTAIKTVWMKDFRGVAEGQLNDLTPLTILVGPNGSGKSTVLEALHIACTAPDQDAWSPVWQQRPFVADRIRWLHRRGASNVRPQVTVMTGAGRELTWEILPQPPGGGLIRSAVGPDNAAGLDDAARVYFIRPPAPNLVSPLDKAFSEAVISDGAIEVVQMIQGLFGALDLRLLIEKERPALFLIFPDHAIPVAAAGAGAEWLVHLGLSLVVPEGSLVLIEEPELHLHPAAIIQVARIILHAVRRGTQVILTTHSLELMDAFQAETRDDQELEVLSVHRLSLRDGVLKTSRIPGPEVAFLRSTIEEDLR